MKVSFHTLGCKLNFSETSTIARSFAEQGFERVKFGELSDVILINTCTVTGTADKKCRQAIKKAEKKSPKAFIIVTGCYAQLQAEKIAQISGVDAVLGMNEKFDFFKYFNNFEKKKKPEIYSCKVQETEKYNSAYSSGDRTRSFLKIQDGCDYPCTYCTIPKARGKSRNKSIKKTLTDVRKIAKLGYKEIILTGVNIGDFGKSTNENFTDLLKKINKINGIERYRISSIEPNLLHDEIIEFVANSDKFLPHFHIPLQSGSNKLLKLMKRRYKRETFARRIEKINKLIPFAFIGVDVIVGFPDETDEDFNETYNFLSKLDISFLHVFSYSERYGTPAAKMKNKVKKEIISQRSKKLHYLSNIKHRNFYEKNLNTKRKVLFEKTKINNSMFGFTDNYIKVEITYNELFANKIKEIYLGKINENGNMAGY